MRQIDTPDGLFHDGRPATGELGTILSAAWLNAIQAEILSVLDDQGIAVDPATSTQLLAAIQKIAWGTQTTLAGYGIRDAASEHHHHEQSTGIGTETPGAYGHNGTNMVVEVRNPATTPNAQAHCILSSGADLPSSAIGTLTWVNPSGMQAYLGVRTGNAYDSTATDKCDMELELRVRRKGVLASRYRIAESGNQIWNEAVADDGTPFQFYGAVRADTPSPSANNNLLSTTAWVRTLLANKSSFLPYDWVQIGSLIIQWVEVTPEAGSNWGDIGGGPFGQHNYLITLPTTFPNACLRIIPGIEMRDEVSDVAASIAARPVSNGQIRLMAGEWAGIQQNVKLTAIVIGW